MNLVAKIEAALRGPRKLAVSDAAALEFQNEECVVFALGLIVVHQASAPGHHFHDRVLLAEEISSRGDAMTRKIVHGSPAGLLDIPEVGAMRAAVRFA